MNKTKLLNILKALKPFIAIFTLAIIIFGFRCCAKAESVAEYEKKISNNKTQIEFYIKLQNQLHNTAELLRKEKTVDTSLIQSLSKKWVSCEDKIKSLKSENSKHEQSIKDIKSTVFMGNFTITHYDICYKCTGKSPGNRGYGITATGTRATANRTIAVDPRIIPLGSKVIINGHTYIAEDTGGAIRGNKIDICVSSHSEAIQKGRLYNVPVYIKKG